VEKLNNIRKKKKSDPSIQASEKRNAAAKRMGPKKNEEKRPTNARYAHKKERRHLT